MRQFLKDPLFHFLLGGLALYLALDPGSAEAPTDDGVITLDDAALVTFLQFRAKSFDPDATRALLRGMDAETRRSLEEEYLEEEILYREAQALGLDAGDDIIRKRLIQKMDFLLQGFEGDTPAPTEGDLAAYYEAHKDRYRREARVSLTHVFVRGDGGSEETADTAKARAQSLLATLNEGSVPPQQAGQYGDRFPYLRTYADRGRRLIREHFGTGVTDAVFTDAPVGRWAGPYVSPHGYHLVFVHDRTDASLPPLEAVAGAVLADLTRDRRLERRAAAIDRLREKYTAERPAP
jgi:hypothetical protein